MCQLPFLTAPFGLKGPPLICENKADAQDKCLVVDSAGVCDNFDDLGHTPAEIAAALAEGAKLIPLTQGKFAIVDAEDYDWLNKHKWCACKVKQTYYAKRKGKGKLVCMHRQITSAPPHLLVDHINRNGLDNRKKNLRLCTRAENSRNRRSLRNKSSRYKAITATAHKLAKLVYRMLKYGMDYVDSGQQYYENRYMERVIKNLTKRAREMGYAVVCTNTGELVS